MAGDWIKVEKTTIDKPEILAIADACGVSYEHAFGAWFRLWSYFDSITDTGIIPGFTRKKADYFARLPGIGEALDNANWIIFDDSGCQVMNWDRHNGKSAKQRALAFDRKRKQRVTQAA